MSKTQPKKILFVIIFAAIGFLAMQIKFTQIIGSNLKFSLFDFYGPIAAGFVGSIWGLITVMLMQLINWAVHGLAVDTATIIRFFPMLLAVLYFAKKSKLVLIVPVIAMLAFWLHPEGRQAWYYALYWLIPLAMYFLHDKLLFARALGATFTAHSVGGALWIWTFNLPASVWTGLIPVVWLERGLMAIGLSLTFMAGNYLLSLIDKKIKLTSFINLDPKYSIK